MNFEIPPHACDCHTHVYANPYRFPLAPDRVYTPEVVEAEELVAFHKRLGFERVVVVHPNTHGTDNSVSLYAMSIYGPNARGVALIDRRTSDFDIESMTKAGMRGARINLRMKPGDETDTAAHVVSGSRRASPQAPMAHPDVHQPAGNPGNCRPRP